MDSLSRLRRSFFAVVIAVVALSIAIVVLALDASDFQDAFDPSGPYGPWLLIALVVDFVLVVVLYALGNEMTSARGSMGEPVRSEGERHYDEDVVDGNGKYRRQV